MTDPERRFEMLNVLRWLLIVGLTLLVVGLIAYARGRDHQRGDDVGALRAPVVSVV